MKIDALFGAVVHRGRERLGMTMDQLAGVMVADGHPSWNRTTVWNVEKGKRQLTAAEAIDIEDALGVSFRDAVCEERRAGTFGPDGFRSLALTVSCLCGAVCEVACAAMDTADEDGLQVLRRADATCWALQKQLQAMAGSMNQTKEGNDA